jgi:CheY-like chemotaxis protein/anti-sigma regulatory factor (Ser/Thr protein kinase)
MESIGTLAGGIAHDFNNILGVIVGQAELMEMYYADDHPEIRKGLVQLLGATGRAKELVKQILTFSHQSKRDRAPLDIAPVVEETVQFLRATLPSTIEIRAAIESRGSLVAAHPTDLHQVLMNLGTNAAHAMGESGGQLDIRLERIFLDETGAAQYVGLKTGAHLRVSVSDTGCGIPPEVRDRIFEPYFTTKEVGKGTGLGLAVVHGIVKSLSGRISVNSEPGRGTAFQILIPCTRRPGPAPAASGGKMPEGGTEHILLVDDEPVILRTTKAMLERLGYRVTAVGNGRSALEAFGEAEVPFDLLITDMTMPKMTGFELAEELMKIRPDLPVILCTGFSETMPREKAMAAGIRRYLEKPVSLKDLAAAVRSALVP